MGQVVVGGAKDGSDGEQTTGGSSALEHSASLPLGGATPDAVVDAVVEGVVQALGDDRARGTDALGHFNADSITGEEGGGGEFLALAVVHPWGGGFHAGNVARGGERPGKENPRFPPNEPFSKIGGHWGPSPTHR